MFTSRICALPTRPFAAIIHGIDSRFRAENYGDNLYVLTDNQAENYRVIKVSLADPAPEHWQTIVPQGKDVISEISIVGGKLFVSGLHDVVTETRIFTLDGKPAGNADLSDAGLGQRGLWSAEFQGRFLQLRVLQYSAHALPLRCGDREDRRLRQA